MTFLKDYEPVEERISRFYKDHATGRILTEIAHHSDDFAFVVFKAAVFRKEEDTEPAATGFAYEKAGSSPVNRTSHIENCETSAIGRALANLNYAAKGQRASREEMTKVSAGSTAPTSGKRSAARPAPQPEVSANSWAEEETEGSAAPESRPSSSSWDVLIEEHGRELVWETAKQVARDLRDGLVPIKVEMLDKCSPRVYAATAEILSQAKASA